MQENYNKAFLKANNISFSYKKGELLLKDITASFYKGEFVAIIGPNGSGKTTFGKILSGILSVDTGKIYVDSVNIENISLGKIGKKIGYLFQEPERQLFAPTVREEIAFAHSFMGKTKEFIDNKVSEMIEIFSLQGLENASPYKISRGERQRVALAAILTNEPSYLILDEPTTGLDSKRKGKLAEFLYELKKQDLGLAVISHDKDFIVENADRVLKISGGVINEV
ncbi:MAG TPA: ABC transporter ATP-binding protein [Halanaerobiales bacterium]|nr:ABC transporter ATP-binding protein [Halanaerobiales bacterium]